MQSLMKPEEFTRLSDSILDQAIANLQLKKSSQDPVQWILDNFRIPETPDRRLVLAEYQIRALREALSRDPETGKFKYSVIIWGDIKKSIKSTIAAAVALWRGFHVSWGQVFIVANDLNQAASRVGYYLTRAIELNSELTEKCTTSNYTTKLPNRTTIQCVPIDPSGEAGSNADMVVFSELWGAHEGAKERMWTEMTLPPNKFGESFRWVEGYAGYSGESKLLEQIYDTGRNKGRQLWPDLPVYVNDAARVFCLWNEEPRLPWQTPEYYASEAAVLDPAEFSRIHRNQWISSTQTFVPIEWWDLCKGDVPSLEPGEQIVCALDAAVSGDCFGIVGVSRRYEVIKSADGKETRRYTIIPRYVRKWVPPLGGKLEYSNHDNPSDRNYPEGEIEWLKNNFSVVQWPYDPYQLHYFCREMMSKEYGWFREFEQGTKRLLSDKGLYDLIRDRRILHDDNSELREHVKNANSKKEGERLRIVKRSELLKIDLAVCLSMASYECLNLNLNEIPLRPEVEE